MKTKKLSTVVATLMVAAICISGAFRINAQTAQVVELKIGDAVYEFENYNILRNKANKITSQEITYAGNFSFDQSELAGKAWVEHFKPLFSKERAEELKVRITLRCICDSTGLIREIEIFFKNREEFEMFTLCEIKAMEDAAKTHRYENLTWHNCENVKYGRFIHPFSPYLLYFEKPK